MWLISSSARFCLGLGLGLGVVVISKWMPRDPRWRTRGRYCARWRRVPAQSWHVLWRVAGANTAAIFIGVPIDDVVATVLDQPKCPRLVASTRWTLACSGEQAADRQNGLRCLLATLRVKHLTLDQKAGRQGQSPDTNSAPCCTRYVVVLCARGQSAIRPHFLM